MVMRQDRLKQIEADKGPHGASRDERNLKYWQAHASENSPIPARGTGKMSPDTTRKNADPPRDHDSDAHRLAAKSDRNSIGSSFMPGVRRSES